MEKEHIARAVKRIQAGLIETGAVEVMDLASEPKLVQAVHSGNADEVAAFIASGADPNESNKSNRNRDNFLGEPPLVHAVRSGRADIAEMLLKAGANASYKPAGRSLLFYAIVEGHLPCLEVLLRFGAKANETRKGVPSPLEAAIDKCSLEAFKLLIAHGADSNALDSTGDTLLYRALCAYNMNAAPLPAFAEMLNKNRKEKAGQCLAIIREMLKFNPDVNRADRHGHTPLMAAVQYAPLDIVERIIQLGADIDAEMSGRSASGAGLRPIHCAISTDRVDVVKLLLGKGADIKKSLPDGQSVVDYAKGRNAHRTGEFLRPYMNG